MILSDNLTVALISIHFLLIALASLHLRILTPRLARLAPTAEVASLRWIAVPLANGTQAIASDAFSASKAVCEAFGAFLFS